VFSCRFLAGARIPGYFTAGTLGMSYLRFLLLDVAGVLITVPVSIWLGQIFGGSVEELHRRMGNLHLVLAFVLVSLVLVILVRIWVGRRWSGDPPAPGAGGASSESPPD
jgi:membrane protein DedA with SNARE-associated domain